MFDRRILHYVSKTNKVQCRFQEAAARTCSVKKVFLKISQNTQKNTFCQSLFLNKVAGLMFSYEFCKIFKSTFFTEHLRWLLLDFEVVLSWKMVKRFSTIFTRPVVSAHSLTCYHNHYQSRLFLPISCPLCGSLNGLNRIIIY